MTRGFHWIGQAHEGAVVAGAARWLAAMLRKLGPGARRGALFAGARDLYEITSPSMLAMNRAMQQAPGVIGSRQAGAGFGGCMVAFVDGRSTEEFRTSVVETYLNSTGLRAEVYPVRAATGAGVFEP